MKASTPSTVKSP
jgi:hypothetical protein